MAATLNPDAPAGKSTKYAHIEHERRFLLEALPPDLRIERSSAILDRYVVGTRLRLRRMTEAGATTVFKFTQKAPTAGGILMTNTYLSPEEYEVLSALPARELRKTRHFASPIVIDVFEGPLQGLVLAEIEVETEEEMREIAAPSFAVAEVTDDPRFTGGRLATMTAEGLRQMLSVALGRGSGA